MRTLKKKRELVRAYRDATEENVRVLIGKAFGAETGTIYFIRGGKYVKIGYTERPVQERLCDLQTGSPFVLEVIATVPGDRYLESQLHSVFSPWRTQGEWFLLAAPGLRQFITELNERLFVA